MMFADRDQRTLLLELRQELGLATHKDIAETLSVSVITVGAWMAGRRQMRSPTRKLAESLIKSARDKKKEDETQKSVASLPQNSYEASEGGRPLDQQGLITALRQAYGLTTHQEVADLLGVSNAAVQKWSYGTANMRETTRRQIRLLLKLKGHLPRDK